MCLSLSNCISSQLTLLKVLLGWRLPPYVNVLQALQFLTSLDNTLPTITIKADRIKVTLKRRLCLADKCSRGLFLTLLCCSWLDYPCPYEGRGMERST